MKTSLMEPIPEIQRVVCAANRHKRTGKIICGARHFDLIMHAQIKDDDLDDWHDSEQGFIDQWGNFLTRQEAFTIAKRQNQFNGQGAPHADGILYSEDLY